MLENKIAYSRENLSGGVRIKMASTFRDVSHAVNFVMPSELLEVKSPKIVVTADIGNYSGQEAFIESAACNKELIFLNFIDYPALDNLPSNMFTINVIWTGDDPRFIGKFFKILPHLYLEEFKENLWIDSNIKLSSISSFFECLKPYDFSCMLHDKRKTIISEAEEIIFQGKDDKLIIEGLLNSYEEKVYDFKKLPLLAGRFLYRKNNDQIIKFNQIWFDLLVNGSIRDQLSLPIAESKVEIKTYLLPSDHSKNLFKVQFHNKYDVGKYGNGAEQIIRSYISRLKYKASFILHSINFFIKK